MTGFVPVHAAEPWALLPKAFHGISFFWFALLFNLAFAAVYVAADLNLFYDGGFFSFTVAAGRPWELLWCNLPGRFAGAYLLTSFPARLYGDLTGNAPGAVQLYAILYACWPSVGIVATRLLDRTADKHVSAYCNLASLTTPLFTFGFPTEVWVTFALFWPTLCCVICAISSFAAFLVFFLLLPLFIFTHESAIVFTPLLFLVALLSSRGIKRAAMLAATVAVVVSWALVETYIEPCFPWARSFIQASAQAMLSPRNVVNTVSISIVIAMAGWILAAAVSHLMRCTRSTKATLIPFGVGFLCFAVYAYYARDQIYGVERYPARTLVLIQTLGLGILCAGSELLRQKRGPFPAGAIRAWLGPASRFPGRMAASTFTALAVYSAPAHVYANARFIRYWAKLNEDIDAIIRGSDAVPSGFGLIAVEDGKIRVTAGAERAAPEWRLASSSIMDHVVMRAPGYDTKRIVYRLVTLTGGTCEEAKALEGARGAIGPNSAALLRYFVCEVYDGLYPPATWRVK